MDIARNAVIAGSSSTELVKTVADIWAEILGCAVELDVNFFDAGGDSLRLLRLQNALNDRFTLDLQGVDLFEHTTIRSLSAFIAVQRR